MQDDKERPVGRDDRDDELQRRFARNLRTARQRAALTQADTAAHQRGGVLALRAGQDMAEPWQSMRPVPRLRLLGRLLLGLDDSTPRPAPPPPPDDDPPAVRRLLRALRKARPMTVRIVTAVLCEREKVTASASKAGSGDGGESGEAP